MLSCCLLLLTSQAETSITIDDVTHVIDSCHVKETRFSPQSSTSVPPGAQLGLRSIGVGRIFHRDMLSAVVWMSSVARMFPHVARARQVLHGLGLAGSCQTTSRTGGENPPRLGQLDVSHNLRKSGAATVTQAFKSNERSLRDMLQFLENIVIARKSPKLASWSGICWRLCPENFFEKELPKHTRRPQARNLTQPEGPKTL